MIKRHPYIAAGIISAVSIGIGCGMKYGSADGFICFGMAVAVVAGLIYWWRIS